MSNNIRNIKTSIGNILSAATNAVAATTELTASATGVISSAITHTPAITKEALSIPFSAYQGVLEEDGMDKEEARTKAFHYVNQDLATTIREMSVDAGKLAASLWDDMDADDDNNANSKEEAHRVA